MLGWMGVNSAYCEKLCSLLLLNESPSHSLYERARTHTLTHTHSHSHKDRKSTPTCLYIDKQSCSRHCEVGHSAAVQLRIFRLVDRRQADELVRRFQQQIK